MDEVRAAARTFNRRLTSPNAFDASRGAWRFPNAIPFTPLRDNADTSNKWPLAQPAYTPRTVDILGRHDEARVTHTRHIFSLPGRGPREATLHLSYRPRAGAGQAGMKTITPVEVRDHGQSAVSPCIPITNTPCGATLGACLRSRTKGFDLVRPRRHECQERP